MILKHLHVLMQYIENISKFKVIYLENAFIVIDNYIILYY